MRSIPELLRVLLVSFFLGLFLRIVFSIGDRMSKKIQRPKKPDSKPALQEKSNVINIKDYLVRKANKDEKPK